jgi:hypothetical protein
MSRASRRVARTSSLSVAAASSPALSTPEAVSSLAAVPASWVAGCTSALFPQVTDGV